MFTVLNRTGRVVDTCTSYTEALHVVTYLTTHNLPEAPFHCTPIN